MEIVEQKSNKTQKLRTTRNNSEKQNQKEAYSHTQLMEGSHSKLRKIKNMAEIKSLASDEKVYEWLAHPSLSLENEKQN